jgi:hypothetical protein
MILLTAEELCELTGSRRAVHQVEWLDAHGWKYVLSRKGEPRVARAFFVYALGSPEEKHDPRSEPNWATWNKDNAQTA